jgi:hypothetical protein
MSWHITCATASKFSVTKEVSVIRQDFRLLATPMRSILCVLTLLMFLAGSVAPALAMSSGRGGALPQPLPLFPPDNWWNLDISGWPVDSNSTNYISYINNGGIRRLHPDLGGDAGTTNDPNAIYGMPYAVVSGVTANDLKAVQFQYWDESDGVDLHTGISFPFYPIPPEAIAQARWVEGGDPANVDRRSSQDRHLLIVDYELNFLYELYNVFYDTAQGKWFAGSGAFFDMNTNTRRPDTWTSADAAGLAILPGLIRYDEVYDSTLTDIRHAFRVTVRATNGYVYPASHRAGSTSGALPMGARLRLKASVDVTQRTNDPNVQKIFRAMQKYGLIVADNGSDMYVSGTYDTRWNNDIINPAFRSFTANDFEVVELGYNTRTAEPAALNSVTVSPSSVAGGQSAIGAVTLTHPAPVNGAVVSLVSANSAALVPGSVIVPANLSSTNFSVNTKTVSATTLGNITATYSGVNKSATVVVTASTSAALSSLALNPTSVIGGSSSVGTVTLNKITPNDAVVTLISNKPTKARVPATVTVPAGTRSAIFDITTTATNKRITASISASLSGVVKNAALTMIRR